MLFTFSTKDDKWRRAQLNRNLVARQAAALQRDRSLSWRKVAWRLKISPPSLKAILRNACPPFVEPPRPPPRENSLTKALQLAKENLAFECALVRSERGTAPIFRISPAERNYFSTPRRKG